MQLDLKASPRYLNRLQKQMFLKKKIADDHTPDLHNKTHYQGGTSILMNNKKQANLSLNLKNTNQGAAHQLD